MKRWILPATFALLFTCDAAARSGPPAASASAALPPWVDEDQIAALDAEPLPAEKSAAPTPAEWKTAPPVHLTRVASAITSCRAYRVREWLKIHCQRQAAGVRQLAGSTEGVVLWIAPAHGVEDFSRLNGEIILPIRRGDRRVFDFFDLQSGGYEGVFPGIVMQVEESWLEGDERPTVALYAL